MSRSYRWLISVWIAVASAQVHAQAVSNANCAVSSAGVLSCRGSGGLGDGIANGSATPLTITPFSGSAGVTVTLASNANPSVINQTVTFTAGISGGNAPGGSVSFNDGSTVLCTNVALASGSAACTTSMLYIGSHSITATYSGDANNAGATSASLTQVVNLSPTTITLNLAPNPATVNQSVTASVQLGGLVLDAKAGAGNTAIAAGANHGVADGAYAAAIAIPVSGGGQSCTASLSSSGGNWSGNCTLSFPAPGSYAIKASYPGTSVNAPSSATQTLVVKEAAANTPSTAAPALSTAMLALLGTLLAAFAWKRRRHS